MGEKECGFLDEVATKEIKKQEDLSVSLPLTEANTCSYCSSVPLDVEIQRVFGLNVCKNCRYQKIKFVTKTVAFKEFLLNSDEFKHLKYLSRPNPHKGTWHDMHLFLEDEIHSLAIRKYKSLEAVEDTKKEREQIRKKRKITKLKSKIRDLKRRTILVGSRSNRHVHEFKGSGPNKKCVSCGMEVEQDEL